MRASAARARAVHATQLATPRVYPLSMAATLFSNETCGQARLLWNERKRTARNGQRATPIRHLAVQQYIEKEAAASTATSGRTWCSSSRTPAEPAVYMTW